MKKVLKILVIVAALVFVGIQFIRPDMTNKPVLEGQAIESTIAIPPDAASILARSCADCHTNNTRYPWYSQVAPFSWMLADHVADGRAELNLSLWNTYDERTKTRKFEEMCEQVEDRLMPLPSYLWIHRDAVMSDDDIRTICAWTRSVTDKD